MKVLNSRPHGAVLHGGKLYPPGEPVEVDGGNEKDLSDRLLSKGSHVKATAANVKAGEEAADRLAAGQPPLEDEEDVEETDSTTGKTKTIRRKKGSK